ncbi:GTPase IMAP family member 8-like isoform X2 [Sardina pilchardus]|uniref:GTPase IMAP family member 8-like isoform X2 n=1 Tax=Sardina pilchardus TaxID=27697 RepID=UPI002E14DD91
MSADQKSENPGGFFEIDRRVLTELEKKRDEERRAEKRKMKVQKQRETLRSAAGGVPHISDMRIVLLGYRAGGKSSSGNTILNREEFGASGRTAECVKREGATAGRRITVVEAPGWWLNYTVEETPERDNREIVLSVSLCPPGPHALLLNINVNEPFIEKYRRGVQQHMELLGERVWSHTIVLFTKGDLLGDTSIEQLIETRGEALQWVVEKCGNRYHVVDNKKSDGVQVTELLEKIEEMVAGNRGHQFEFDTERCKALQEKKREEERRAEERKMKVQKQRETLRSAAGGVPHISDMRIVLLGYYRAAGKSSSGNTILGRKEFGTSGRAAECVTREGETAGRHVTVVEAPGWFYDCTVEQTAERHTREIVLSVSLCPPGPHALLLNIRVDVSFTERHRRAVQQHMELLGERVWSHTIVLFTSGDLLGDTSIEQHIESGGEALQWVVEKCGNRYHVVDNMKSDGVQVTELLEKIEEMVAGNRGHQFEFDTERCKALQEKKREEERRAEERKMKVQKQRETLRSAAGGVPHISDMRIVLLGIRAAGKSSSGNTILGRKEFGTSGRAAECVTREGETAGRHVTVVEAPGWFYDCTVEQTAERHTREIVLSVSLCPPGPHALLLLIRVTVSFTETHRRGVQQHMELLGERVWSHTIVLFTSGDLLGDTSIEQHIESGGEALHWVVEKCGNRYHVVDNMKSDGGQVTELLEKIEEMVMANSGEHSMDRPPRFSEGLPDDCSAGDSAYGSTTKPTAEPELMKAFKQLSTAASTQSSGIGSADTGERSGSGETGERSGSAEKPSPIIPPIRVNTNGATAGQWKTPSRPTHGKTLTAKSKGYPVTNPFVDETTIVVDYTACIGHGSYGTVHMGSYQGTPAAIKIIPVGDNPVTTNEFIIPGRLSHPNVVRMMAVAKSETQILIANEYIHGANLHQILHTDTPIKLQPEDKLFVALDIALAVQYIHGRNVIHQDLKPANIMCFFKAYSTSS